MLFCSRAVKSQVFQETKSRLFSTEWMGSPVFRRHASMPMLQHQLPHPPNRRESSPSGPSRPQCGSILRSEEHTSELQSRLHLVCRLLLEKKNNEPYLERRRDK